MRYPLAPSPHPHKIGDGVIWHMNQDTSSRIPAVIVGLDGPYHVSLSWQSSVTGKTITEQHIPIRALDSLPATIPADDSPSRQ